MSRLLWREEERELLSSSSDRLGYCPHLSTSGQDRTLAAAAAIFDTMWRTTPSERIAAPSLEGFIQLLYGHVAGRAATADEMYYMTHLPHAGACGQLAYMMLVGFDHRTARVAAYYQKLLRRPHPPLESAARDWVYSHLDLTSLRVAIERSQEFYDNAC